VSSTPGGAAHSRMVDIGAKQPGARAALARASVLFPRGLLRGLLARGGPKGPIEEVARAAGILAAKRTADLIPMCHTLALDAVEIEFAARAGGRLEIRCAARCRSATGVEMEALTGAAIAALTVYDMTKALDPAIRIERIELLEKHGGKHGPWRAGRAARPR
jgi:cyclic pyranopterin phosphate synthase